MIISCENFVNYLPILFTYLSIALSSYLKKFLPKIAAKGVIALLALS